MDTRIQHTIMILPRQVQTVRLRVLRRMIVKTVHMDTPLKEVTIVQTTGVAKHMLEQVAHVIDGVVAVQHHPLTRIIELLQPVNIQDIVLIVIMSMQTRNLIL